MNSEISINLKQLLVFILTLLVFCTQAQTSSEPGMQDYLRQAEESYNAFKNGPAFDALNAYSKMKEETLQKTHLSAIDSLDRTLAAEIDSMKLLSDSLTGKITGYEKEIAFLTERSIHMLRNKVLFVIILLIAAAAVLYFMNMKMNREIQLKEQCLVISGHAAKTASITNHSGKLISDLQFSFSSLIGLVPKTLPVITKFKSMSVTLNHQTESISRLEEIVKRMDVLAENGRAALEAFGNYFTEHEAEKRKTNLNAVIDDAMHLAYLWTQCRNETYQAVLTRDLEKILPETEIVPGEIRKALFHLFCNAFESTVEKSRQQNNYQPKVSVSSRKLPRFIQVKIKDNGQGIDNKFFGEIIKPFGTITNRENHAGLGLSEVYQIIKEGHGGEIIFESEPGTGTDVIIRFPIKIYS